MTKSKARPLQVGDVCVTVNSKYPAINNGLNVVIIGINPAYVDEKGVHHPYVIRRVDGQPLGLVTRAARDLVWCKSRQAHCAAERLQRLLDDPDGVEHRNVTTSRKPLRKAKASKPVPIAAA